MNIWEHLLDEKTPQCMQDHINGICKLRQENPGLMMHIRWRYVVTLFYETHTEQYLTHRYGQSREETKVGFSLLRPEEKIKPGFNAFTLALYDGCGCRISIDLYSAEKSEPAESEYGQGISIICKHLLKKEITFNESGLPYLA